MNLKEIFQTIQDKMLLDFTHFQSQIHHRGERGVEREEALKSFLETYLPKRFAISTGEIVDHLGNVSHQCDLIIFDAQNCPLLLSGENFRIFPCEPVFAVIEVKSKLDRKELLDSIEKIRVVKNFARAQGPIAGIVFAYKSAYKTDGIQKIAALLRKQNKNLQLHEFVDMICILDAGILYLIDENGFTKVSLSDKKMIMTWLETSGTSTLLSFFINLLSFLNAQQFSEPDLISYLAQNRGFAIGTASLDPPPE